MKLEAMIGRRALLKVAVAGGLLLSRSSLFAKELTDEVDYEDVEAPFPSTSRLFGTKPALGPEEDKAREIFAKSPSKKSLLETAQYFERLKISNAEGYMYNAQWPNRWNPLIVGFYQPSNVKESLVYKKGDTIPWCAAFINWCLQRGGYKGTLNAMSGSFRLPPPGFGKSTTNPKAGDIIVFRNVDSDEAKVGFGHVGIFIEKAPGGFMVLGGNQKAGKRYSSVNTAFFPEKSDKLMVDSIRSLDSITKIT